MPNQIECQYGDLKKFRKERAHARRLGVSDAGPGSLCPGVVPLARDPLGKTIPVVRSFGEPETRPFEHQRSAERYGVVAEARDAAPVNKTFDAIELLVFVAQLELDEHAGKQPMMTLDQGAAR